MATPHHMTKETKAEIVIVGLFALLLLWLWLSYKRAQNPAGNGWWPFTGMSPGNGATASGPGLGGVAPVEGDNLTYNGGSFSLPANAPAVTIGAPSPTPSSCGCGCGGPALIQFSNTETMLQALPAPGNVATAAVSAYRMQDATPPPYSSAAIMAGYPVSAIINSVPWD
jgi:hypothetical protein